MKKTTKLIKTGINKNKDFSSILPPLYLSSNYGFQDAKTPNTYDYSRSGNPNRALLVEALSVLEGGVGGEITSTGMSAITLVLMTFLKQGDTIIISDNCYGGTLRLFFSLRDKGLFNVIALNQCDTEATKKAIFKYKPQMLWIETPSNPLIELTDISELSYCAKSLGALVVADNTFLTPMLQQPLALGADIVMHSLTKYLNGHGDSVSGAVIAKTQKHAELIKFWCNNIGTPAAPFDCYMVLRGLRSFELRMNKHRENAQKIFSAIKDHPKIKKVHWEGDVNHPHHQLAKRQQKGFGAMLSFDLDGTEDDIAKLVGNIKLFELAESLGGVESIITIPYTMTHVTISEEDRKKAGITKTLVRISPGLEDGDDLADDLIQALNYL